MTVIAILTPPSYLCCPDCGGPLALMDPPQARVRATCAGCRHAFVVDYPTVAATPIDYDTLKPVM